MSSAASATHLDGDIVPVAETKAVSAQEKYYRHMMMKEQLAYTVDPTTGNQKPRTAAEVAAILGTTSELDDIIMKCYLKVKNFKESSPQWSQLYTMTGKKDPWEMAEVIGSEIYEQQRSETLYSFYAPSKNEIRNTFLESSAKAAEIQKDGLKATATALKARGIGSALITALTA